MNELSNTPQRTSKRNAAVVDQDSMEKAAKLKAKKNLDTTIDKGNKESRIDLLLLISLLIVFYLIKHMK